MYLTKVLIDFLKKRSDECEGIFDILAHFSPQNTTWTQNEELCVNLWEGTSSFPQLSCCMPVIQTCQNWSWWSFLVQPRWPTHSSGSLYSSQATPGTEWHQMAPSSGPHKELRGRNIGTVNKWEIYIKRREIKGEQKGLGFFLYLQSQKGMNNFFSLFKYI